MTNENATTSPADEKPESADTGTETPEVLDTLDRDEQPTSADDAPGAPDAPEADPPQPRKSRARERIEQLSARAKEAEARAAAAERAAERAAKRAADAGAPEPNPDSYDYGDQDARYIADLAAHKAAQTRNIERKQDADDVKSDADAARDYALSVRHETYLARVDDFRETAPDYDAVAGNPSLPISETMRDIILDADNGPQIAYWLGKNPAEAAHIAQMTTEREVARRIGQIEARLSAPRPRKVSQAPKPVKSVADGSSASGFDPATGTVDDMEKHLRAKGII